MLHYFIAGGRGLFIGLTLNYLGASLGFIIGFAIINLIIDIALGLSKDAYYERG